MKHVFLWFAVLAVMTVSCTVEERIAPESSATFSAEVLEGDAPKVYIEKDTERLLWNGPSYEKVRIFLNAEGSKSNIYNTEYAKEATSVLHFLSGDLKDENGYYRAFSPSDAPDLEFSGDAFKVRLPASQIFVQESSTNPRPNLYLAAACGAERHLAFEHLTHLVKVTVSCESDIKITRVRIAATGGGSLSGDIRASFSDGRVGEVSIDGDGCPYVENTMGGIACTPSNPRTVYLFAAPGIHPEGFVVSIDYRIGNDTFTYSVSSPEGKPFNALRGYKTSISVKLPLLSSGRGAIADADYVDLSAGGTANCYVVNNSAVGCTGEYYKFRADIRGNGTAPGYSYAIPTSNDGAFTVESYYSDGAAFIDRSFGNNGFSYNNGYICFRTTSATAAGSVLVSLRNREGKTLWSWHIWSAPALAQLQVEGVGTFLNMNIGARQTGFSSDGGNGFYYQWGRKDPMPQDYNSTDNGALNSTPPFRSAQSQSLANTILNPYKFRSGGYVYNDLGAAYGLDLWNAAESTSTVTKTMFDPCPPGYSLPSYAQWTNPSLAGKLNLPMASYRTVGGDNTQKIYPDKWNSAGYYWIGCAKENTGSILRAFRGWATSSGKSLGISSDTGTDGMYGCCVRCVLNGSAPVGPAYTLEKSEFVLAEYEDAQIRILADGAPYDIVRNPAGLRLKAPDSQTVVADALGHIVARTCGSTNVNVLTPDGTVVATASIKVTGESASFDYFKPVSSSMIYSKGDINYGPSNSRTAAQSFAIASDGSYFTGGICNNTTYPHVYIQRMSPNGINHLDYMTFLYAGHCNNFEVETRDGEHYIWMCNLGGLNENGQYANEQVITRVKYEPGKEYLPENCTDIYWFGKKSGSLQMSADFENDLLSVGWGGPYIFNVYRLSDVLAVTATTSKTMQPLTRGGLGSQPITEQQTITPSIKVHDCSKLTPLYVSEFTPVWCGLDSDHAYQGCAIHGNRIYLLYGNGGQGPYDAIVTAVDFNGKVVSGPNHLALDDDKQAYMQLGLGGGWINGYFEPEGLQIRTEGGRKKMYVGFIWQDDSAQRVWKHATLNINPDN